jgi:Tfp pilus assembly protein PilF
VIARAALALVAVGVVVALAASLRDHDRCQEARRTVFGVTLGREPLASQAAAIDAVREHCRGTTALVAVAGALWRQERPAAATRVARQAARAEPESASAWAALATVAQAPAEARAAERRRRSLDPLGHPSLNRSSGRSTR